MTTAIDHDDVERRERRDDMGVGVLELALYALLLSRSRRILRRLQALDASLQPPPPSQPTPSPATPPTT